MGVESPWPKTKRYWPPTRASTSQESREKPQDLGTHQRWRSAGLVHASNTMRGGALMVRVTTNSRSDLRSTVVGFLVGVDSVSLLATIAFLLLFEFFNKSIQLVE